ncbi:hypothetical protein QTP88_012060 [Uroleucon formosanum]
MLVVGDVPEPFRSPITITVSDINHREPLDVTAAAAAATISHDPVATATVTSSTTATVIDPLQFMNTERLVVALVWSKGN